MVSFHLSLSFVSPLSWEPFHPLLLINSPKSSRIKEVSLGEEAALWRKEVLDYYQQKTCRENSCSRVIGAVTSRHCRRNQLKVEKNESKKNPFTSCEDVTNSQGHTGGFSSFHSCQKTPGEQVSICTRHGTSG